MIGGQVAKYIYLTAIFIQLIISIKKTKYLFHRVIESKHPRYEKNSYVYAQFGWTTHSFINPDNTDGCKVYPLPDFGHRSVSLGLGVLGMPG